MIYVYEGRGKININENLTLTLTVDDEDYYSIDGSREIASTFNAAIEFTIGFKISLKDKKTLDEIAESEDNEDAKDTKKVFDWLVNFEGVSIEEDDEYFACSYDVEYGQETTLELIEKIYSLAVRLEELGLKASTVTYDDEEEPGYPFIQFFIDEGPWIGPSAYAIAKWDEHELIINSSEILLDGNNIKY